MHGINMQRRKAVQDVRSWCRGQSQCVSGVVALFLWLKSNMAGGQALQLVKESWSQN